MVGTSCHGNRSRSDRGTDLPDALLVTAVGGSLSPAEGQIIDIRKAKFDQGAGKTPLTH